MATPAPSHIAPSSPQSPRKPKALIVISSGRTLPLAGSPSQSPFPTPMIDFVDNPYLGELLNTLHEDGVLISLICHAPVAMVSARYRVAGDGQISTTSDHHFKGARLTAVPKHAELFALTTAYPKVPGHKTRLTRYLDEALKEAGYQVETATNPAPVRVVHDEKANLLTGNGPQAIDDQAAKLRQLLDGATQRGRPATTRTPA